MFFSYNNISPVNLVLGHWSVSFSGALADLPVGFPYRVNSSYIHILHIILLKMFMEGMLCTVWGVLIYFSAAKRAAENGDSGTPTKKSRSGIPSIENYFVRWEWEGDKGKWMQYADDMNRDITDAFVNDKTQVCYKGFYIYIPEFNIKINK